MAPLNTNLDALTLPPDAESQLVIDEIWGDSQMGMNLIRIAGQWPVADLPFVGRLLGIQNTTASGVAVTLTDSSFYGITSQTTGGGADPFLRPGDAWASDGNTSDHFNFSAGWNFEDTGTELRQLLIITIEESSLYTGSFPLANQRLVARVFYRMNADNIPRVRRYPHRNGSRGGFAVETLGTDGGIGWFDQVISSANPGSGAEPVGLEIWTDSEYSAGDTLEILGVLIYRSDTGSQIVPAGYVHVPIYKSGGNATSLAAGVSDAALDALHETLNEIRGSGTKSVDLVQFEFGHNKDGAGYTTGLANLRAKVLSSLSDAGHDEPDWLFWAMWSYDKNQSRMSQQAEDLFTLCAANDYGFINLFETYNGDDPATNGARFDGTPATYTMDGSNLHPADSSTAQLIVQDIEEHWQEENWVVGQDEPGSASGELGPTLITRPFPPTTKL